MGGSFILLAEVFFQSRIHLLGIEQNDARTDFHSWNEISVKEIDERVLADAQPFRFCDGAVPFLPQGVFKAVFINI